MCIWQIRYSAENIEYLVHKETGHMGFAVGHILTVAAVLHIQEGRNTLVSY